MVTTNEQRLRQKIVRRRERTFTQTPLMDLGTWMFKIRDRTDESALTQNTIQEAPRYLLEAAQLYVEVRLVLMAAQRKPSARTRSTERWLGRWMQIIEGELLRQQQKETHAP